MRKSGPAAAGNPPCAQITLFRRNLFAEQKSFGEIYSFVVKTLNGRTKFGLVFFRRNFLYFCIIFYICKIWATCLRCKLGRANAWKPCLRTNYFVCRNLFAEQKSFGGIYLSQTIITLKRAACKGRALNFILPHTFLHVCLRRGYTQSFCRAKCAA